MQNKSKYVLMAILFSIASLVMGFVGLFLSPSVVSFAFLSVNIGVNAVNWAVISLRERL